MPCVLCRRPLGAEAFALHIVVTLGICPQGDGHIGAGAVTRHLRCEPVDDDELYDAASRVLTHTCAG